MEGIIFDIKRFAIHDGPGIRQTIFFKGCPLSCWWCHNPESRSPGIQSVRREICSYADFKNGDQIGRKISSEQLMESILKDKVFYEHSNGGVTFSGGEPTVQFDFLIHMLKLCKDNKIHTALDTTGHFERDRLEPLQKHTDLFLYDLKHLGEKDHIDHTGVSNNKILNNLLVLNKFGARIFIRFPLIPGVNDDEKHLRSLAALVKKLDSVEQINILPYHNFGRSKYEKLGIGLIDLKTKAPVKDEIEAVEKILRDSEKPIIIGG